MDHTQVVNRLVAVWAAFPHLRFGQLLDNVMTMEGGDLFYVEDEELVLKCEKWLHIEEGKD